jgi:FlaG/FlaF family flagellin (archaellin)
MVMTRTALRVAVALVMGIAGLLWAAETPMTASASTPAATGKISYQHDRNHNTSFTVHAKHLASPDSLTPAKSVYVVWTQPRGKDPQNQGTLKVNENLEGSLDGTIPAQIFDVFVTAEDSANVQGPSGPEVLRATIQHH